MRLTEHVSDPCLRRLLQRRLGCSPRDLDTKIEDLLKRDEKGEFDAATKEIESFTLSHFENYVDIENALSEYIFLMVLNGIYNRREGSFLFDRISGGLMIENIVDAIIRTRITKEHKYKFVDKKNVDFVIYGKKDVEVAEIQCKTFMDYGRSQLGAKNLLKKLGKSSMERSGITLALFCGYVLISKKRFPTIQERRVETNKVLNKFQNAGWHTFFVFKDFETEYSIDKSVLEFVGTIEKILLD